MAVNEDFWCEIEKLRMKILSDFEENDHGAIDKMERGDTRREMLSACERIVEDVVTSISSGEPPLLRVPRPSSREVYYESVWLYGNQGAMDRAAEDVARLLSVPRYSLHLTITGKGLVAGSLTFTTHDGVTVNVQHAQNGVLVPESVEGMTGIVSDARYILVVEKDATFQKLVEAQVHRTYGPAILITGKGYPDVCTRQMVHHLWRELRVPVLALTDADPYGMHIAAIYKFGALRREMTGLAVGGLAWLGVLPSDLRGLQLPDHALLPLTPSDHGKLASLAAHPALSASPAWLCQIREQQEAGFKAEIQSLSHIAADFLAAVYLPTKLRQGGWIL